MPNEHRHLLYGGDAATQVVASWSTSEAVRHPRVEYRRPGVAVEVPAVTRCVEGTARRFHHARLGELQPGALYQYRPVHDGVRASSPAAVAGAWTGFRTAPSTPAAFHFTAAADMGTTPGARALVAAVLRADPAFHLHPGDLAYANVGGNGAGPLDGEQWDRWLALVEPVAAAVPWLPVLGNHDVDPGRGGGGHDSLLARFGLPANGPPGVPAYTMRYGSVLVLALDGNDVTFEFPEYTGYSGGRQTRWLAERLAAARTDPTIEFVIAALHYNPFGTHDLHGSDGGVRGAWVPLFDRFAVDLVVCGHNHGYERSLAVRGGVPDDRGTVYVTVGGGGGGDDAAPLGLPFDGGGPVRSTVWSRPAVRLPELASWSVVRDEGNSLAMIDVEPATAQAPGRLRVRAQRLDGREIDTFVLTARSRGALTDLAPARSQRAG